MKFWSVDMMERRVAARRVKSCRRALLRAVSTCCAALTRRPFARWRFALRGDNDSVCTWGALWQFANLAIGAR